MPDCAAEISVRAPRSEQVEEVLGALKALRALGMELVQALVDEVRAATPDEPGPSAAEAAMAFQRLAKAVRMTAALELRVLEEADAVRGGEARARTEAQRRAAEERRRQGRANKGAVADILFEVLMETAHDADAERHRELDEDLQEWVGEERDAEDFAGMDERQMLDSVCEALGLVPDPALWDKGQYIEAIAAAIIGPKISPERPVAKAVASARANLTGANSARSPDPAGPP